MLGYVHSLQSLGTVDGPGVRAVVFLSGCPLRCVYCHNPDTWIMSDGTPTYHAELAERIKRLKPYIKDGGVTFSGGEPLLQAEFLTELSDELKNEGLHIALDTSGAVWNDSVKKLLDRVDLILLDIKFTVEDDYNLYTGASLVKVISFLEQCDKMGKAVWIRHVVVPGLTDSEDGIHKLCELIRPYRCVRKIELLPFKKLCLEKYESLGIPFSLSDTPECKEDVIKKLNGMLTI